MVDMLTYNGSELALLLVLIGGWLDSNRASLLLGGVSACVQAPVLVYPFLSVGNVKNVKSLNKTCIYDIYDVYLCII